VFGWSKKQKQSKEQKGKSKKSNKVGGRQM
jgi:hypothetical protein